MCLSKMLKELNIALIWCHVGETLSVGRLAHVVIFIVITGRKTVIRILLIGKIHISLIIVRKTVIRILLIGEMHISAFY